MTQRAPLPWPERILIIVGLLLIGLWVKYDTEVRARRSAETKQFEAAQPGGAFSDAPAM